VAGDDHIFPQPAAEHVLFAAAERRVVAVTANGQRTFSTSGQQIASSAAKLPGDHIYRIMNDDFIGAIQAVNFDLVRVAPRNFADGHQSSNWRQLSGDQDFEKVECPLTQGGQ
jgi:hypothetical protein